MYALGHSVLGYGEVELPLADGYIHTVVSNYMRSFKLGSAGQIKGVLRFDEATAVVGEVGPKARMIPLKITVRRFNDPEERVYNCQVVSNQIITPSLVRACVGGAAFMRGQLPPEHMIEYKGSIKLKGLEPIEFENISSGSSLSELITETAGPIALIMNNPYQKVEIESLDFDLKIDAKNILSHIWSVELSDSKVKAGEVVDVSVVVESYLSEKKRYHAELKIPDDLPAGRYGLEVMGSYEYGKSLRKAFPQRFTVNNLSSLIDALNSVVNIRRDRLYFVLVLPFSGVTIEGAELANLPATKALVLQDRTRSLAMRPRSKWLEKVVETDTVIVNRKRMEIIVEK